MYAELYILKYPSLFDYSILLRDATIGSKLLRFSRFHGKPQYSNYKQDFKFTWRELFLVAFRFTVSSKEDSACNILCRICW